MSVEKHERRASEMSFSFCYDGQESSTFLPQWDYVRETFEPVKGREQWTETWTNPGTGFEVCRECVRYDGFAIREWVVYLRNRGQADTGRVEEVLPLDAVFATEELGEVSLHHFVGSPNQRNDYEPQLTILGLSPAVRMGGKGWPAEFRSQGGRPTNGVLPNFNVQMGESRGTIVVVGWPGQWKAIFVRDGMDKLRVRAGQELTHFVLHPGEVVRTPRIIVLDYEGDWIEGQNVWRRWMIAHNLPRPGGKRLGPHINGASSWQTEMMVGATVESQIHFIDRYLEEDIPLGYWWMDAGWYPCGGERRSWVKTGTWEVDKERYPDGLRPVSDHAHTKGVQTILWFEPERVHTGTRLTENHPDWLLGADRLLEADESEDWRPSVLLNLGLEEVQQWVVEMVDGLMTEQGIDVYRQDFNIDPLPFWRASDAEDRQGITEIRYVEGYLAFWDGLLRRRPGLLIDTCSSGGRRNDLETLRRAVPLLQSDYILEPVSQQNHNYGIAFWIPFHGAGVDHFDAYGFWSCATPALHCHYDMREKEQDFSSVREMVKQWREVVWPCYWGDYYPLTPYYPDNGVWMAWQYHVPEEGRGVLQAFRRKGSADASRRFRLRGLRSDSRYNIRTVGSAEAIRTATGEELLADGLSVRIAGEPGAVVVAYEEETR